ncbi:hypothetical protein GCM10011506_26740 [Marivirga lumbricoides]|uniref:SbsA Ig-like domain-containing protein n=1 Tax=Marivirga lumbricoides TaxID=1046115 RepID=A0ABQ1MG12_9BACT|nr:hypothetical protein GCM10011506_26740 [Marivirga lumbricoides]
MNKIVIPFILLLCIYACATPGTITGGEKDVVAPVLYESTPKHQSVNFKGKEIRLYFNEWMQLDNLQKELIITPRTNIEYEQTLKKQELILTLKSELKDSTTYTFNFRKGLKDITEGNVWENPVLAFSTGNYLDSLVIQGTVKKIETTEPAKNYLVGIYDASVDTANLRQGEPLYFTTTDEQGNYKLQNLKPGQYLLYTFKDANNNLINESASEPYGFYPTVIDLKDSIPNIDVLTYKINEDTLKLKKSGPTGKDFVISYNKGIENYNITNTKDPDQIIYATDEEAAGKIRIFKENFPQLNYTDSLKLVIKATDSINNQRADTVFAKFRESRITSESIKITMMPEKKILTGDQQLLITTNKPVAKINTDSILIKFDSIQINTINRDQITLSENKKIVKINLTLSKKEIEALAAKQKAIKDSIQATRKESLADSTQNADSTQTFNKTANNQSINSNNTSAPINSRKKDEQKKPAQINGLHLYVGKGAFIGIEQDSTASNNTIFTFKNIEEYGIIKGYVASPPENYIVQLLDNKYKVIDSISNQQTFTFNYVSPGDYFLRAVADTNNNKKWDAGNPLLLEPAEEIIYLNEKLTVKANWEVIDKNIVFEADNTEDKDVDKEADKE